MSSDHEGKAGGQEDECSLDTQHQSVIHKDKVNVVFTSPGDFDSEAVATFKFDGFVELKKLFSGLVAEEAKTRKEINEEMIDNESRGSCLMQAESANTIDDVGGPFETGFEMKD